MHNFLLSVIYVMKTFKSTLPVFRLIAVHRSGCIVQMVLHQWVRFPPHIHVAYSRSLTKEHLAMYIYAHASLCLFAHIFACMDPGCINLSVYYYDIIYYYSLANQHSMTFRLDPHHSLPQSTLYIPTLRLPNRTSLYAYDPALYAHMKTKMELEVRYL